MELKSRVSSDATVITVLAERIDAGSAIRFKDSVRTLSEKAPERVILDLAHVNFIDSSGLGAIVAIMKLLDPQHRLELASLSPTVEKVFRLTRMDSVFLIHQNAQTAVKKRHQAG